MPNDKQREVFARTIRALRPYRDDIVLIGGWVHALYIAEANSDARAVHTSDIDFTIPSQLLTGDRPTLIELVQAAGYELDSLDFDSGILSFWQMGEKADVIDLDLLTEAPEPRDSVPIEGQPGLVVPGYPNQRILLENSRWISLGKEIHDSLEPPCEIRIPQIPAYALVKGLSSKRRPSIQKMAKDIVYLYEIVRDPVLGHQVRDGMAALALAYPVEYRIWRQILSGIITDTPLILEISDQLRLGHRAIGSTELVAAAVSARLRRLLGETPPA